MTEPSSRNCPEDADFKGGSPCLNISREGYLCTRDEGHKGKHHAHGKDEDCIKAWGWQR